MAVVQCFLFQVEQACFLLLKQAGARFTWDVFVSILQLPAHKEVWNLIMNAFRDALLRLDFRPAWRDNELVAKYMNR